MDQEVLKPLSKIGLIVLIVVGIMTYWTRCCSFDEPELGRCRESGAFSEYTMIFSATILVYVIIISLRLFVYANGERESGTSGPGRMFITFIVLLAFWVLLYYTSLSCSILAKGDHELYNTCVENSINFDLL